MAYKKPQDPLTNNGFGIYPLTTADQVILSDGSRLEKNGQISIGGGTVKTVSGIAPDSAGNVALTAEDVGALPSGGTAADSSKLGGKTLAEIMLTLYPVGSIYMSVVETSPASLFGGTWEILNDVFLLAAGSYANAGTFGGEAVHTLTLDEIPSHGHALYAKLTWGYDRTLPSWTPYLTTGSITDAGSSGETDKFYEYGAIINRGGGAAHNNMPPYLAVYMWKRVK